MEMQSLDYGTSVDDSHPSSGIVDTTRLEQSKSPFRRSLTKQIFTPRPCRLYLEMSTSSNML